MPAKADELAFRKSLRERAFAPVYYFHGPDEYLKDGAVRDLIEAAVDPATRDFNLDVRSAGDLDGEAVASLVSTPPMMAERRVIVLRDVAALKKDAQAEVERFVEQHGKRARNPDVILVLVAQAVDESKPSAASKKKGDPFLGASMVVEWEPLDSERLPRWVEHYATTELGATIEADAVELLLRAVGNDMSALGSELEKLASYCAGRPIDVEAIGEVVGIRHGETLSDFLDMVTQRNAQGALRLLPRMLEQPRNSAVVLVMALGPQMLALQWGRAQRDAGVPAGRLNKDYWDLLKTARGNVWRQWKEAITAWVAAVDLWTAGEIDVALQALANADQMLKGTRLSSEEQVMQTLILTLCGQPRAGRRTAA